MIIRPLRTLYCCIVILMMIGLGPAFAGAQTTSSPFPYQLNRSDEDYSYLRDPARRSDFWDPVQYMQLNASGSWYLSLGGEARERY